MSMGKSVTVGWKYFLGVHIVLCHGPVDEITELSFGDRLAWSGSVTNSSTFYVNNPELFGGDSREGGVSGNVDVSMGKSDETPNSYLQSKLGNLVPAYRGVTSMIFKSFMIGSNNPYLKAVAVRLRRIKKGWNEDTVWYETKAQIGPAMNPAHIVYQLLTDPEWGMGYPTSSVDDAQFRAAADKLYDEGFGLCLLWNQQAQIEQFLGDVVNHVGAVVRASQTTGKFQFQLFRDDYDVSTLFLFDENNVIELEEFERPNWGETTNEIVLGYTDVNTGSKKTINAQDLANIAIQNSVVSSTREYPGIVSDDIASRVALRDLRASSNTLAKVTITTNRKGFSYNKGDVVKFSWADKGIVGMPIRILDIDHGELANGTIRIQAVEDVFGLPATSYTAPQGTLFSDPAQLPTKVLVQQAYEVPYWDLVRSLSTADFNNLIPEASFLSVVAKSPADGQYGFEIATYDPPTNAYISTDDQAEWCPSATIVSSINKNTTSVVYNGENDIEKVVSGGYAYIDNEAIEVVNINKLTKVLTFKRAVLDTVPTSHSAGARVWFADTWQQVSQDEHLIGETKSYKLLTIAALGTLPETSSDGYSKLMEGRFVKPYPPANVLICSQLNPDTVVLSSPLDNFTLSWVNRNRKQQTASLVDFSEGNITPETGTTYTYELKDVSTSTVIHSASGVTNVPITWSDLPYGTTQLRLKIYTVRGGYNSWQTYDHQFEFTRPAPTPPPIPANYSTTQATLNGTTGLSSVTRVGAADDSYYDMGAIPFPLFFFNTDYGTDSHGGIFIGTNSYLTFGSGKSVYSGITPSTVGLAILVGAADRSSQFAYEGSVDSGASWTIRTEGDQSSSGSGTTLIWEMRFYPGNIIQLTIGAHAAVSSSLSAISNGAVFQGLSLAENTSYVIYSDSTGSNWAIAAGSII